MMTFPQFKTELFQLRKAYFEFHQGFEYIKARYFESRKIFTLQKPLGVHITNHNLSIHILTGRSHLVMMLWAMASFYTQIKTVGELYIHNDGSLSGKDKEILKDFFPLSIIIDPDDVAHQYRANIHVHFPDFLLLKKLIDPYFVSSKKFRLIVDSDLLWFQRPKVIEDEIHSGCKKSLMMQNNAPLYVYLKGGRLDERRAMMNSGIVLYAKDNFDVNELSDYLQKVDTKHPDTPHFIEQAGYATCLKNVFLLPIGQYHIKGPITQETVVKHYTSPRRVLLYTEGIKNVKL